MKVHAQIFFTVILVLSLAQGCKQKETYLSEDMFTGEWYSVKGDVEAYSFLKDSNNYIFVGTRNMHPVVFGSWKIDRNKFIMISDNAMSAAYTFSYKNDTLVFNDGEQIYTRTEPLEARHPEVKILIAASGELKNLKFSPPRPDSLIWGGHSDSNNTEKELALKGYSISVITRGSSGAFTEISDFLEDNGFELDAECATEKFKGFRDDEQIVTVRAEQTGDSAGDSVIINITSGLIVN